MSRPRGPRLQTQLQRPGPKAEAQRCQWSLTRSALPFTHRSQLPSKAGERRRLWPQVQQVHLPAAASGRGGGVSRKLWFLNVL